MRISDWSSDVCSSDLRARGVRMSTVTVQDLAKELNRPVDELLSQFGEAGVSATNAESPVSGDDKVALLNYLKQKTGGVTAAEPRRITLKRKIGRAHVGTPVTNAHLVCRLLLENKKTS